MEKSGLAAADSRNGTPAAGGRSRSRIGMVHSQPGSRSTSPTSLRSYQTYYDAQGASTGVSTRPEQKRLKRGMGCHEGTLNTRALIDCTKHGGENVDANESMTSSETGADRQAGDRQTGERTNVVGRAAPVLRHPEEHRLLPGAEPEPVRRHDDAQVPRADGRFCACADAETAADDRVHLAAVEGGGDRPRGRPG